MTRLVRSWLSRALVAALGVAGAPALAEESALGFERTPPRLSFTDGEVTYWRPGASDWTDARVNTALAPGDELSTGPGANLELQVGSRAWVRAGEATQLGLTSLEPDFLRLELTSGTAALDLRAIDSGHTLEIDTPNAAFTIERPGFYRVEVASDRTSFTTRRGGRATIATQGGLPTEIDADEQLVITGSDAPVLVSQGAPALDDWDRWNYSRSEEQSSPDSARYVPDGVYGVDDLDEYGAWRRVPTYGAVWVPRVAASWVPYSTGYWVSDPYYGWTWVDDAPWGWAPFHYGRWVHVSGTWAWSPGPRVVRSYYAPALVAFYGSRNFSIGVSFGGAPYASWVALGWGEPVVPWWGPRGCRGAVRWAGWGGPRFVNDVEINHFTSVNVNAIHRYAHGDRDDAFVAVDRRHFGQRNVRDARISRFDRSRLQPVGGRELGARPDRGGSVSADRRREGPPREVRERRVVTRRDTLEPGVRDPSRGRGREATRERGADRSATETRLRQDRRARQERSSPPPTRMARAETSGQRRSVSERVPAASRRDAGDLARQTTRGGEAPRARGNERQRERRASAPTREFGASSPPGTSRDARGTSRRETREASPLAPRQERSSPRPETRQHQRSERFQRPESQQQTPRSERREQVQRPQRFERREQPARPERESQGAPRSEPDSAVGGGGRERGSSDRSGRGGGEGRRSSRGRS